MRNRGVRREEGPVPFRPVEVHVQRPDDGLHRVPLSRSSVRRSDPKTDPRYADVDSHDLKPLLSSIGLPRVGSGSYRIRTQDHGRPNAAARNRRRRALLVRPTALSEPCQRPLPRSLSSVRKPLTLQWIPVRESSRFPLRLRWSFRLDHRMCRVNRSASPRDPGSFGIGATERRDSLQRPIPRAQL